MLSPEMQNVKDTVQMSISYLEPALEPLGSTTLRRDGRTFRAVEKSYAALTALRMAQDAIYALEHFGESGN